MENPRFIARQNEGNVIVTTVDDVRTGQNVWMAQESRRAEKLTRWLNRLDEATGGLTRSQIDGEIDRWIGKGN
jgi:hypothetical protein